MKIFSGISDALFGGGSDVAKDQKQANKETQKYTKEQADQARNDALGLFGASSGTLKDGYQAAIDAIGGTTRQQIDTTARGNYYGQEALLAGMPQFQNAILGMPVDNSKLQPRILHPEANLQWMWNSNLGQRQGGHRPLEGLAPNELAALKTMHEAGLSNSQIQDLAKAKLPQQKQTGGSSAQAKALFDAGLLSGKQYQEILKKAGG